MSISVAELRKKFNQGAVTVRELIRQFDEHGWEEAWKKQIIPWETIEGSQPLLRSLLTGGELSTLPKEGRALVPGCGRGHDAILITATLGWDSVGIDSAPTAIQAGRELLDKTPTLPTEKVTLLATDFFSFTVSENERFDLIYDYMFFVAIPPSRRTEWGRQIQSLIKPGGYLIALIHPLSTGKDGPPFYARPEHYTEVLGEGWTTVISRAPDNSSLFNQGNEHLLVLKKE